MIEFFVAGVPKSMSVGKSRRAGNKIYQGRVNTEWATLVGYEGRLVAPPIPPDGPMGMAATFRMPRPKSAKDPDARPIKRPDLDNLFHKLTDQWSGVHWRDDAQLVETHLFKTYSDRPGVLIQIWKDGEV